MSPLEIWKPAFRTDDIMVPNFLNLPVSVRVPEPAEVSGETLSTCRAANLSSPAIVELVTCRSVDEWPVEEIRSTPRVASR